LGCGNPVVVFFDQRQDAHRRIIVKDQFALGRLAFHLRKHLVGAITYHLDLIPLRRIGHRDP
jgi:hypothetical protein